MSEDDNSQVSSVKFLIGKHSWLYSQRVQLKQNCLLDLC